MSSKIDFSIATSGQIASALCEQLVKIRLARNITQDQLAKDAGIALRTLGRLEKQEQGVSLDTFVRVMIALGLQNNLQTLLPDPTVRPVERVATGGVERKRARPKKKETGRSTWVWGDESEGRR